MGVHRGVQRVPLREAAQLLGVSKDAVRQRIRRGTIRSEKGEDGRVYVFLDASSDSVHYDHDQELRGPRRLPNEDSPAVLVDELRDRIRYLERQVEEERSARYRADELLAQLMQRIPQLEPPTEPRESPSEATPQPGRVEPQTPLEGAQEPREGSGMHMPEAGGGPLPHDQQRPSERPWWRRVFGG